ncbi:MAG: hypothetical protein KAZ18_07695, partial [Acinetobacter sp.]|nr:hypothetical protein [Acinetobacter sp.]
HITMHVNLKRCVVVVHDDVFLNGAPGRNRIGTPLLRKQRILRLTHPPQTQCASGLAGIFNLCATFCATTLGRKKCCFVE